MKIATKVKYDFETKRDVSWRAILAGLVSVLSLLLILNLFGLAAGFGSIEPTEEARPLEGLGTGIFVWWGLSNVLALALGGYVAARVGVSLNTKAGVLQGVLTWAIYAVVSAWLLTSAVGKIVSGVGNMVGSVLGQTGEVVKESVGPLLEDQMGELNISLEDAKNEIYALLEDTNKEALQPERLESQGRQLRDQAREQGREAARRPSRADAGIEQIFRSARNIFQQSYEELDREALVNVVVERTDMNRAEAERTVDEYLAEYENLRRQFEEFKEETRRRVNETAEEVAETAAEVSLYLAIALILGALAAAFGGYLGVMDLRTDHESGHYVVEDPAEYRERTGNKS
jgi:membrane protein implicated in regulation of membrane protease activity